MASAAREDAAERRARLSLAIKEAVREALARHVDIHIDTTPPAPVAPHNVALGSAPDAPGLPPRAPSPGKFGLTLSIEPSPQKAKPSALGQPERLEQRKRLKQLKQLEQLKSLERLERDIPPDPAHSRQTPARQLELARDKAAASVASSVKTLAFNGVLGGVLGYAYARNGGVWYLIGAALLGLFPCLSALRALFRAGAELKRIEKLERKNP
jgi:hypothetical protein